MVDVDLAHPLRIVTPTVDADVLGILASAEAVFTAPQVHRLVGQHSEDGVRRTLKRLSRQGIVSAERAGNAWLYRLNRNHLAAPAIVAIAQLLATLVDRIAEEVQRWERQPVFVSLFGSAAKGRMQADSDIDVFVVRPDDVDVDILGWREQVTQLEALVTGWTGNDTRVLEFSEAEVQAGLQDGAESVLVDIAAHGLTVFGPARFMRRFTRGS